MSGSRIANRFDLLEKEGRSGLVAFLTAGDPNFEISLQTLRELPASGADVIELGMPFSDPMADGPAIQASSQRALKAGINLKKIFSITFSISGSSGGRSTIINPSTPAASASETNLSIP